MKVNVFNLIILDESGSMESIKKPALDGLNETLQSIQSAQKTHKDLQQHYVSLISFNSAGIKTFLDKVPVSEIRLLTKKDYQPSNSTPLFDAMGYGLTNLRKNLDEQKTNQVLVTIITDGCENASKEYNGKMIKSLVQELKELG
jgi:Mg-chelatase subunit ChlD